MAVKKKQSSSGKTKRKTGSKTSQKHKKNVQVHDTLNTANDANDENGLDDTLMEEEEIGDPDMNVLAQEEEILEDEEINIKSPEIAAGVESSRAKSESGVERSCSSVERSVFSSQERNSPIEPRPAGFIPSGAFASVVSIQ